MIEQVRDFTDIWLELWPEGIKSGGKYIKSDKAGVKAKMTAFRKKHNYGEDVIMKATLDYLNQQKNKGWAYTRCAIYFIEKKGEGSDLASHCEAFLRRWRQDKIEEEYTRTDDI